MPYEGFLNAAENNDFLDLSEYIQNLTNSGAPSSQIVADIKENGPGAFGNSALIVKMMSDIIEHFSAQKDAAQTII
jgi:hypothetical protein